MSESKLEAAKNDLRFATVPLDYARILIRDLIQQAYDAGKATRPEDGVRPSTSEVNEAIANLERTLIEHHTAAEVVRREQVIADTEARRDKKKPSVYWWPGIKNHRHGEHVIIDEGRTTDTENPVCRVVCSWETFTLGHTMLLKRHELQEVDPATWRSLDGKPYMSKLDAPTCPRWNNDKREVPTID